MEVRKWEDLNSECLVKVFEKVGFKSLIFDLPSVCKSWYKATLNPICWKFLDFAMLNDPCFTETENNIELEYHGKRFSVVELVKFAVSRSCDTATQVVLPSYGCTSEALDCIANGCPMLKALTVPYPVMLAHHAYLPKLICNWKNLEFLRLVFVKDSYKELLAQISLHCKNFVALFAGGMLTGEVYAIGEALPKLKSLGLLSPYLCSAYVKFILSNCKELEFLEIYCSSSFDKNKEMLEMASRIKTFRCRELLRDDDSDSDDDDDYGWSSSMSRCFHAYSSNMLGFERYDEKSTTFFLWLRSMIH